MSLEMLMTSLTWFHALGVGLGVACVGWTAYELGRLVALSRSVAAWDERGRRLRVASMRERRRR
jgi:hypothetical protein